MVSYNEGGRKYGKTKHNTAMGSINWDVRDTLSIYKYKIF
jgi:hypothetical protein